MAFIIFHNPALVTLTEFIHATYVWTSFNFLHTPSHSASLEVVV